jgi:hypothetical protein
VNNNTKINKIRFEKIIEKKRRFMPKYHPKFFKYSKATIITKLSPIKEEKLPSHDYYT